MARFRAWLVLAVLVLAALACAVTLPPSPSPDATPTPWLRPTWTGTPLVVEPLPGEVEDVEITPTPQSAPESVTATPWLAATPTPIIPPGVTATPAPVVLYRYEPATILKVRDAPYGLDTGARLMPPASVLVYDDLWPQPDGSVWLHLVAGGWVVYIHPSCWNVLEGACGTLREEN